MKIKILFLALHCYILSLGQVTEGFEGTPPASGWTYNSVTHETVNFRTGSKCAGFNANLDEIISPMVSNPLALSFWWKRSGTSPTSPQFTVQYSSSNSGPWTNISTGSSNPVTNFTTTYQEFTADLSALSNIYIRILHTRTAGANVVYIDDFSITTTVAMPTITLSPISLSLFTYVVGSGPSPQQSFNASGTNLTQNITLNAPLNYEISTTNGSGFTNSIILTQISGTVNSTTIYVRLKAGLSVNSYNESISAFSSGATNKSVSCTGSVTGSTTSDLIVVTASEAASISSIINNPAPLTVSNGIQVLQFKVRDGGATLNDSDNLPTILTSFTIAQAAINDVGNWTDAINTIGLFDGSTFIASGTVNATNIVFAGLNISVNDNTEKTLSLRLSLKCPLGADAFDGEDFGFSIANSNVTFSPTGSGKTTFTAVSNPNFTNTISVIATQLLYVTQPITSPVNLIMSPSVRVRATDSCGNTDANFTNNIVISSSGTLSGGSTLSVNAINGVAVFNNLVHTIVGTNFTLSANTTGFSNILSSLFEITNVTFFNRGDLAILSVNTNIGTSGEDQLSFVCFEDILIGTKIYLTDNGYERQFANEWGGTEGLISITRTGSMLPKGSIIVIQTNTPNVVAASHFDVFTCGILDNNWTKTALSGGSIGGFNLNADDDIWIMQGGNWINDTTHHSLYNGSVLYGWTESGWNSAPGSTTGDPKWSTIYPGLECFTTTAPVGAGKVKFNDPINPDFSTTSNGQIDWISLINTTANWDTYSDNTSFNSGGYDYKNATICPAILINGNTYINGKWTGKKDTNWFNCGNWDTLIVPNESVDVQVGDNIFNNHSKIDITAAFANYYGNIAKAKNLTITGEKVELVANINNKLEVYGNLSISTSGVLDMDDSNTSTADGELSLIGNWTNNLGIGSFLEGNGTVKFIGSATQVINNNVHTATEEFYNVVLDNDFNTLTSNNLIAKNDLEIKPNKNITIASNEYIQASRNLKNDGTLTVKDSGMLYQTDDSGVDNGNITVERNANIRQLDYVYWSSPVSGFNVNDIYSTLTPTGLIYKWDTTFSLNPNGGEGYWQSATGNAMTFGKGFIVRGPSSFNNAAPQSILATFNNGVPNNGSVPVTIRRGNMIPGTLSSYTSANSVAFTANDDNWNLVGNPYPSAISANTFLQYNAVTFPVIEGAVRIWTHGTLPVSTQNPFYASYGYNYTANDYITYNGTATTSGPSGFNGTIGTGQGFFVLMNDGTASTANLVFNNSMRVRSNNSNSQFYKNANASVENVDAGKSRIWLDLITPTSIERTVVGYVPNATLEKDAMYDAYTRLDANQRFYSLINEDVMCIQGRPLPFDENDQVPLGLKVISSISNNYTIAISVLDGLFETQNIYIEDKLLNLIHNLKETPYSFTSSTGIYNDRFVLRYTNSTLSSENFESLDNNVVVATPSNQIKIKSIVEKIESVLIYDILGREIAKKEKVSENEIIFDNINIKNQALIVKIVLENNQIITRKIIL